jgi:mannose-6-phosphate isomerase-like protein (cupin superfamily)
MEGFSKEIWAQLFPAEKEFVPPVASPRDHTGSPTAHWTSPILRERAAYLRKLAHMGDGSASETLREYPQHRIMLSVRNRSGIAEVHQSFADWFFVLEGSATLVTGGTVDKAETIAPGEMRGASISNGNAQPLKAGDVVYVAAGLPHQFVLAGNQGVTSLVMKIEQNPSTLSTEAHPENKA